MPKRKSLAVIDKRIAETKRKICLAKQRYDKLTLELQTLNKEKVQRQSEIVLNALAKSGKSFEDLRLFVHKCG